MNSPSIDDEMMILLYAEVLFALIINLTIPYAAKIEKNIANTVIHLSATRVVFFGNRIHDNDNRKHMNRGSVNSNGLSFHHCFR